MTKTNYLLNFKPRAQYPDLQVSYTLPSDEKLLLPFVRPQLTHWGKNGRNYILQQEFSTDILELGLVHIKLNAHTPITLHCVRATGLLLYAIRGDQQLLFKNAEHLALYSGTYTLQYMDAEECSLLPRRGSYCYFYFSVDGLLKLFEWDATALPELHHCIRPGPNRGQRIIRQAITNSVFEHLDLFLKLPSKPERLALPFLAGQLLADLQIQLNTKIPPGQYPPEDIPAHIKTILADNMQLPTRQGMELLRTRLGLSQRKLNEIFKQRRWK